MNSKKIYIIGIIIILVSVFFLARKENFRDTYISQPEVNVVKHIKVAGTTLNVDLASTPATQEHGLSGRTSLAEDSGMLFIFDTPDTYGFWMKDMNFPIDMIWLSTDLKVVYIKQNALPSSYPEVFTPSEPAKYVLEVTSGFSEKNKLKVGDTVEFVNK